MRPQIRKFIEVFSRCIRCPEPIVEVGSLLPDGQEEMADLRPFFPGNRYIGCDMQEGPGVDRIENLHHLSFSDREIGTLILAETLEHVEYPWLAISEAYRTLSPDGVALLSSTMHFPIHAYPSDYWRYTPEAFRSLTQKFSVVATFYSGDPHFPHTVVSVVFKRFVKDELEKLTTEVEKINTHAPPQVEHQAAQQIHRLALRALESEGMLPASEVTSTAGAFLVPYNAPGWTLVRGQWLQGWLTDPEVDALRICAGDETLFEGPAKLSHPLGLDGVKDLQKWSFRVQAEVKSNQDITGPLSLFVSDGTGQWRYMFDSQPGIVMGGVSCDPAFRLHKIDLRIGNRMS